MKATLAALFAVLSSSLLLLPHSATSMVCTDSLVQESNSLGQACGGMCNALGRCAPPLRCHLAQFSTGFVFLGRASEGICRDPTDDSHRFCSSDCSVKADNITFTVSKDINITDTYGSGYDVTQIIQAKPFLDAVKSFLGAEVFSRVVCAQEVTVTSSNIATSGKVFRLMIDETAVDYGDDDKYLRVFVAVDSASEAVSVLDMKEFGSTAFSTCKSSSKRLI